MELSDILQENCYISLGEKLSRETDSIISGIGSHPLYEAVFRPLYYGVHREIIRGLAESLIYVKV